MKNEPFTHTWTGIAMQLFIVIVLIYATVVLWGR